MVSQQINPSASLHEVLRVFCFLGGRDESALEVLSVDATKRYQHAVRTHHLLPPQSSVVAEHPGRTSMLLDQLLNLRQVVLLDSVSLRPTLALSQDGLVFDVGEALDVETSCTLDVVDRLGSNIMDGHDDIEFLAGWHGVHGAVCDGTAVVWDTEAVLGHDRLGGRFANRAHDVGRFGC